SRDECGTTVTGLSAAHSSSPFLDASERKEQPDGDRDSLVKVLGADPAPFGEVLGAVGYHYEQWAKVSGFAQGIGVRTRDNPDFTMLNDETLKPRWSVQVDTKRSTYDASDKRYLVATMPTNAAPDLVSLDADNGHRVWCTTLGEDEVHQADPFATAILDDEDVAVLGPSADKERLVRIDGRDGSQLWERTLDADSGDFLGEMGEGRLLLGGRAQFELYDAGSVAKRPAGPALQLVSAKDGSLIWTRPAAAGADVHVLGTASEGDFDGDLDRAIVEEWDSRTKSARLTAIDAKGRQVWSISPARGRYFDATLRAGRILVRAGTHWSAYAVADGHRLWSREVPDKPQFLPYGFELDSISMLDDHHALVGGTTALHTLSLRTGAMTSAPLPTDGINTTYWPYETAISPGLIAVATNTGAVVVRRE
ncbi:MAG: PQQ-binding-like beta-propeller repeat protein, partial [Marmoricola sp.]